MAAMPSVSEDSTAMCLCTIGVLVDKRASKTTYKSELS